MHQRTLSRKLKKKKKKRLTECEKVHSNQISFKGFVSRIYK